MFGQQTKRSFLKPVSPAMALSPWQHSTTSSTKAATIRQSCSSESCSHPARRRSSPERSGPPTDLVAARRLVLTRWRLGGEAVCSRAVPIQGDWTTFVEVHFLWRASGLPFTQSSTQDVLFRCVPAHLSFGWPSPDMLASSMFVKPPSRPLRCQLIRRESHLLLMWPSG